MFLFTLLYIYSCTLLEFLCRLWWLCDKTKRFYLLKIVISTPLQFSASDKGGFFVSAVKNNIKAVDTGIIMNTR